MSYSRGLEQIEKDLAATKDDSPCEASLLLLMRSVARKHVPKSLEVQEMIVDDFNKRLDETKGKKHEDYCAEITRMPFNLIRTVNAISIGSAAAKLGNKEAHQASAHGERFLKNYQSALENCRGNSLFPTFFYRSQSDEQRRHHDLAVAEARSTHKDLEEFRHMHTRCVEEVKNKRR